MTWCRLDLHEPEAGWHEEKRSEPDTSRDKPEMAPPSLALELIEIEVGDGPTA